MHTSISFMLSGVWLYTTVSYQCHIHSWEWSQHHPRFSISPTPPSVDTACSYILVFLNIYPLCLISLFIFVIYFQLLLYVPNGHLVDPCIQINGCCPTGSFWCLEERNSTMMEVVVISENLKSVQHSFCFISVLDLDGCFLRLLKVFMAVNRSLVYKIPHFFNVT